MAYKVYKLTSPSKKIYIGITCQPIKKRWENGCGYKKCPAIHKAIKKYGWDNFQKEILYENLSESEAKEFEISLIKYFKSNNKKYGYNLTEGGDGTRGRKLSEEAKQRIREMNSGKRLTEEQKEHLRQINLGKRHSEETKKKMSKTRMGNKYCLGVKHTEEWKRQMSERMRGTNNNQSKRVICLETMKVYDTITEAKQETGASKISLCCSGKRETSGGFHWKYA